ncbi:hypothetical protein Tco_0141370 [Tanacetum coccineum]
MEIVLDKEEVAIDAIPLAIKPPSIVDCFDKEDLETLWKLVKAKQGSTRPDEGYERVLWGDLKVMFEPYVEDTIWRNQQVSVKLVLLVKIKENILSSYYYLYTVNAVGV